MNNAAYVRLTCALVGILVGAAIALPAAAQTYPSRSVTIITPFAAGSVTDTTARMIAQHLQDVLGQPFVVENRAGAGAGGLLAANAVARANPDGYTLLITTNSTHSAAPGLFKTVPYDPIKDFGTAVPQVKVQKIRALAVITRDRSTTLPDLPTLHETVLPNFDLLAWAGLFAPANLPSSIAERIAGELEKMLAKPEVKERFIGAGVEVFYSGPKSFEDYVKSELVKWTGLIKEVGIQPE